MSLRSNYVMTLWAFGFEAIGVIGGSNFKLLWPYCFNVEQPLTSLFFNIQLSVLVATVWSLEVTSVVSRVVSLQNKIKLNPYFRVWEELFILEKNP